MRIIIATTQVPFVSGGAESHSAALQKALLAAGHEAEIFAFPFNPSVPERILDQMLACRLLDLSTINGREIDRLIALKFPAYLVPHPNKVVWLLHQHRVAFDLWDQSAPDLNSSPRGIVVRDAIRRADRSLRSARAIFTISHNVTGRLHYFCDVDSTPLYHPPPLAESFHSGAAQDYFFFPSRLHWTKRQDLVLKALALTKAPVRVRFAGLPDEHGYKQTLATMAGDVRVADRVEWLDYLTHAQKVENYAHARAVLFPPFDEDYGYITLEAMLSSKAVITCNDSGGPLEFVLHEETGLISDPTPQSLAEAMDQLWSDSAVATKYGEEGRRRYDALGLSWEKIVERLLA
ncbi:MAG: glycosyltransferase family 4 protein [Verrucomicrobiota bacterium]|nr:glycosyltransferase family 4 protein [Verrucomicrobiota bacterium]